MIQDAIQDVLESPKCKNHRRRVKTLYSIPYDAFYCHICNKWLEKHCPKRFDCKSCNGRPKRPIKRKKK